MLKSYIDEAGRLDSEYYSKEYIYEENQLHKLSLFSIGDKYRVTDGEHGSVEYLDDGVKYLTAANIKEGYVDLSKIRYVSNAVDERNKRASVKAGDILISIKGTLGQIAIAEKSLAPCNMNRDVAIIKPTSAPDSYNYLIALFLMGKYGALQSRRDGSGGVQQMITLERLRKFAIPEFSEQFCDTLKKAYDTVLMLRAKSEEAYNEAREVLETEIGIDMDTINEGGTVVRSFAESFGNTGRLDAEYYQPKYDEYRNHILNYKHGYTTPGNEFILVKTKCTRNLDTYPYVEIGDVDIGHGNAEYNVINNEDLPDNAKIMTHKGDLLVSTVRPYRGAVAILREDGLLVSGAFTVLRENSHYPVETLQVLLRTELYKDWLLQFNVGTSYPVIKDDDILSLPIPALKSDLHTEIIKCVRTANKYLVSSKKLLEYAKQAVEMAIEQTELTAIKWLEDKILKTKNNQILEIDG